MASLLILVPCYGEIAISYGQVSDKRGNKEKRFEMAAVLVVSLLITSCAAPI